MHNINFYYLINTNFKKRIIWINLITKRILDTKLSVEIIDAAEINEKVVGKITDIESTINDFPNTYLLKNDDGSIKVPSVRIVADGDITIQ